MTNIIIHHHNPVMSSLSGVIDSSEARYA
jgi:hypothetical protein